MSTNGQIIESALRLVNVIAETESASAEQGAKGLEALNDMLAEWEADGVDLGYVPQDSTTDDFPLEGVDLPIKYNLAVRLADEYGRQLSVRVLRVAETTYKRLVRDVVNAQLQPVTTGHLPMPSWQGDWDVQEG